MMKICLKYTIIQESQDNNMATAAFGALGAAIGGNIGTGFASLGWTAGVMVGTYLFQPKTDQVVSEGTRLGDLKITSSSYGKDIPKVMGNFRLSGNVIWALPINETKHIDEGEGSGGKGGAEADGPIYITYAYDATWAVAFCEGEIEGIRKIWLDNVLAYDYNDPINSVLDGSNSYFYIGDTSQTPNWIIQGKQPNTPAYRNVVYIVLSAIQLEKYGNRIPSVTIETVGKGSNLSSGSLSKLSDVILDLCLDAGLSATDANLSEGDSVLVNGFFSSKAAKPRDLIDILLTVYNFILYEKDFTLYLKDLNIDDSIVIPEEALGANSDFDIEFNRLQELDLAKSFTVKYANASSDYSTSTQTAYRIDTKATNEIVKEFPMAMTDNFAKQLAERLLSKNWIERTNYKFSLTYEYRDLDIGQLVVLPIYDVQVRLTSITLTEEGVVNCLAVANSLESFNSIAQGSDTGGNGAVLLPDAGVTDFFVLDIPTLNNNFINHVGLYCGASGASISWKGANIYHRSSAGTPLTTGAALVGETHHFANVTVLSDASANKFDRVNSIVVDSPNYVIPSIVESEVLNGNNYILVGNEILQYTTSTLIAADRYKLEGLLRGRRGTEHETANHVADEIVVILNSTTMEFISNPINSSYYYSAITFGKFEENATDEVAIHNSGNNLRPLSPWYLRTKNQTNNDIDIVWMRRSRYVSGYLKTLPIVDTPETYKLDIYDGITLLRTETALTTNFTYTSAMQDTDSISYGTPITFKILQVGKVDGNISEITSKDLL